MVVINLTYEHCWDYMKDMEDSEMDLYHLDYSASNFDEVRQLFREYKKQLGYGDNIDG